MKRLRSSAEHIVKAALFGGPRGIATLAQFCAAAPDAWHPAFPADDSPRVPPRRMGSRDAGFEAMTLPIPEMGVLALAGGRAVARSHHVFAGSGELVRETTWYGTDLTSAETSPSFPRPRRLPGTCLSLLSEFSDINYGHFLLDALSRLEIVRQAGIALAEIDHFYLHRPPSRSAAQMLQALGVDPARCLWTDEVKSVIAERMLVTTFPGTKRNYARFVPQALRRPFASLPAGGRRIYIPRHGNRKLVNGGEIEAIAVELGLEIYDFRAVEDEFAFFRTVELAVGPHGSDLSNIALCAPGAKVLELAASDHLHPYFHTIAEGAGLDYAYIVGQSVVERPAGSKGASRHDFHVDPAEFRAALGTLLAELEAARA